MRHGQRPGPRTRAGGALAVVGLCFVLDVFGDAHVDLVGVLWGLGAATGLAVYYVLSSQVETGPSLPPVVLAWAAMVVGAAGDRPRAGAQPVPQPRPQHDEQHAAVLEQQRDPDRHVLDGVEEAPLAAGERHQAVGDDGRQTAAQRTPPSAHRDQGERGQQDGGQADADRHGTARCPAGVEQRRRERSRRPERRRGHDRETEATHCGAAHPVRPLVMSVIAVCS